MLTSLRGEPKPPEPLGPVPAGKRRIVLLECLGLPSVRGEKNEILDVDPGIAADLVTNHSAKYMEDMPEPEVEVVEVKRPYTNAPKSDWIEYAVSQGMNKLDAMSMTKAQLQNEYNERL
jgi:hypothetical protein